jgi:uncharacterized phiE125 gp8 family phage protein
MRPQYSTLTTPAAEPLTMSQAAAHLRVDSTDDTAYIGDLVAVAREYFDSMTGRSSAVIQYLLVASRWQDLFDQTPSDTVTSIPRDAYAIPLYRTPLLTVDSIKYYAPDATTLTTMPTTDYRVVTTSQPGMIQLVNDAPEIDDRLDAIQITFTAGTDCPSAMSKHAIRMLVAHFYENRTPINIGNIVSEIPFTLKAIIDNQRVRGNFG